MSPPPQPQELDRPWELYAKAHDRRAGRLLLWAMGLTLVAVVPLALTGWDPPAGRSPAYELAAATGIVALGLLGVEMVLPARWPLLVRHLGTDIAVRLHRRLAVLLSTLLVWHLIIVAVAPPSRASLFLFVGAPWPAQAAMGSTVAVLALGVGAATRGRRRVPYARWRAEHVTLGLLALLLGSLHALGLNGYLTHGAAALWSAALVLAALGSVLHLRWLRPRRLSQMAYRLVSISPEAAGAVTLTLRADGHGGVPFRPGQFAWLKRADRPLSLAEHPFSYTSSAEHPERISFTLRPGSRLRAAVASLAPDTRMLVDGPHGSFHVPEHATGLILLAGGIGITPAISVLRTAADRGDRRPHLLVHAASDEGSLILGGAVAQLLERLDLRVVPVLRSPGPGWTGARGGVSAELLDRCVQRDAQGARFLICGSPGFVRDCLGALATLGVPSEQIHAEGFG